MKELLLFNIKDNHYAFEIKTIKEIIKTEKEPSSVPHSKPEMIGLLLHRNKAIPIIDLSLLLSSEQNSYENKKIIIIEHDQDEIGFLVDDVNQVAKINNKDLMDLPDNLKHKGEYIFKFKEKLHHLLSTSRITSLLSEHSDD